MIELIIFDMDGLMFDTETASCRAFLEVGTEQGFHPKKEQFLELMGLNIRDIAKKYQEYFGEDVDGEALYYQIGARRTEIIQKEGISIKKGLKKLLNVIDKQGIKTAVASGSNPEEIETNIRNAGLDGRFDKILSTKNVKRGKPFPDIFLEICRELKVEPKDALVLEDSTNGVEAALAGQIPVINIPDLIRIPKELEEQCLAVLDSLDEVISYIG